MLIKEGADRSLAVDMKLAAVLSLVAGSVNSAGFHALGFFSANMTGNASMLSDLLAVGHFWTALGFFGILVAFIAGSFTAASLIGIGRRRASRAIYAYVISMEAVALCLLGLLALVTGMKIAGPFLVPGLSFLMGLQNAATTRISNARVRTTHISGIATDIGIELAAIADRSQGDRHSVRAILRLHGLTIAAFIAGGLAGVLLYEALGGGLLVLSGLVLLFAGLREARKAR